MEKLKADLHIHTAEDPEDTIFYSAAELIRRAHGMGYRVLAITNHNSVTYSPYLRDLAAERGIVLIPGMEATIQGRHVLLYNLSFQDVSRSDIMSLVPLKGPESLVIAPHPFYPSPVALRGWLRRYHRLFDAVEFSHFYTRVIDFNKKAVKVAGELGLPLVGTSDAHQRCQFHTTYSMIESEPHPEAVIEAVKRGRVEVVTRPLSLMTVFRINLRMIWRNNVLHRVHPGHPSSMRA